MNDADARGLRRSRIGQDHGLAIDFNLSEIRRVDPCQQLDERALSRPVLAEQGMDFARPNFKLDVPKRLDTRK